ncbi:DedA family protein [Tabrizicola thermarum]|uniref:DedA family protein n=1 Tax=Tabrizicola thermarum TaxID=2670345 RepID=UPI000FFBC5B2|nr:VTT domain-containing protein [Tabrizicola thermarum]
MTDWLLGLVPQYGLWLLAATTFLSCLALPFPASVLMLTAGGFAAAGDLVLWQAFLAAAAGGIAGDQLGYWAGRGLGVTLLSRLRKDPARDMLVARADGLMQSKGLIAVFLTRWLLSPLGPYVNLIAGTMRFGWGRFTAAGVAGEAVWAGLYVGAGFVFGGNIAAAGNAIGSLLGMIGGAGAAVALGYWLFASATGQDALRGRGG